MNPNIVPPNSQLQALIEELTHLTKRIKIDSPTSLWPIRRTLQTILHRIEKGTYGTISDLSPGQLAISDAAASHTQNGQGLFGYDRGLLFSSLIPVSPNSTSDTTTQAPQIFPGEVFADPADFDAGIRQLLPRYDEMLSCIAACVPRNAQRILELGCGTGELSVKILKRCPSAQVIALDYSPRMLQFAENKINSAGYAKRWTAIAADFGDWATNPDQLGIGTEFDACVSSLAIHHLTDDMKLKLFQQIRASLKMGGVFWNADPILPETPALAEVYQAAREEWAAQQGTTLADIRAKIGKSMAYGYSYPDQLATLDSHLQMLIQAGFETVAVPWKYYGLAIFGGTVS